MSWLLYICYMWLSTNYYENFTCVSVSSDFVWYSSLQSSPVKIQSTKYKVQQGCWCRMHESATHLNKKWYINKFVFTQVQHNIWTETFGIKISGCKNNSDMPSQRWLIYYFYIVHTKAVIDQCEYMHLSGIWLYSLHIHTSVTI